LRNHAALLWHKFAIGINADLVAILIGDATIWQQQRISYISSAIIDLCALRKHQVSEDHALDQAVTIAIAHAHSAHVHWMTIAAVVVRAAIRPIARGGGADVGRRAR